MTSSPVGVCLCFISTIRLVADYGCPLTNVRGLVAWIREGANHPCGHLGVLLHIMLGGMALGVWFAIYGPAWAGVFWLALAAYYTPQLARVRGRIFVL